MWGGARGGGGGGGVGGGSGLLRMVLDHYGSWFSPRPRPGHGRVQQSLPNIREPIPDGKSWLVGPLFRGPSAGNRYTRDLINLEGCRPVAQVPVQAPLSRIVTPLQPAEWQIALARHPDQEFVAFILRGIRLGFRIGFGYQSHRCRPFLRNMRRTNVKASIVEEYLGKELELGRVIGPLKPSEFQHVQITPLRGNSQTESTWQVEVDCEPFSFTGTQCQ